MAVQIQTRRSSTLNDRPFPTRLGAGELALNNHSTSPGLFFADNVASPSTGLIKVGQQEIQIENTIKENDLIKHIFNSKFDFEIGDNVTCIIDWDRRYKLMKMHTSLHLLCSLVNAKVTGGSVGDGKGRLDFNLDFKPNKNELKDNLNDLIQGNHDITISWISAQELDKNPDLVKTMSVLPPRTNGSIRMVRIGDNIDYQPCGGTHVKNTSEIGLVEINKVENKGKLNKRVAISLV